MGDPLGCLGNTMPMIKVNGKLHQPNPSKTTSGPDTLGMKVGVTSPVKEPRPTELLAEGERNTEGVSGRRQLQIPATTMRTVTKTDPVMSITYFVLNVFVSKYLCFLPFLISLSCHIRCIDFTS